MSFLSNVKNKIIQRVAKRINEQNFIEKSVLFSPNTYISGSTLEGSVKIGAHCRLHKVHLDGNVEIGDNSSVWGPNTIVTAKINKVSIGKFCSIARNVSIQEYNHKIDTLSTYHINANLLSQPISKDLYSNGSISIGNDVWIGAGAVILSGVTIGNGAVIGANSVVTKDIPPFAIVGGNPTKIIKFRFSDETIKEIQELSWWDWSKDKIKENASLFINPYSGTKP